MHLIIKIIALSLSAMIAAAEVSVRGERAVIAVGTDVAQHDPPGFGLNIAPPRMSHWDTEPWHNEWWLAPNPNPFSARIKFIATGGGPDHIECLPRARLSAEEQKRPGYGAGIGYYDVFRDGFFDNGRFVIYRYENGKASLIREGRIRRFSASKDGDNKIEMDGSGPAAAAGDEVIIGITRYDIPPGTTRTMEGVAEIAGGFSFTDSRKAKAFVAAGGRMVIDADAPPNGGGGSLRITIPEGAPASIGYWLVSGERADWPRLRAGSPYRLRFWAKGENLGTRGLNVQIASFGGTNITLTSSWAMYDVPFTGAVPKVTGAEPLIFTAQHGTLWLDNVSITELVAAPDAFYPEIVHTLKEFKPNTLRLWSLQCNRGFGRALDTGLGPRSEAPLEFRELGGASSEIAVGLHQELELCRTIGADPWIIVSTQFFPDEYDSLMEYLSGPETTPYGKKRAQWGQKQPWTEVFRRITLELGNETWNGMFATQFFAGRAKDYGSYAQLVFSRMQTSQHFRKDRFSFMLNGWSANTSRKWGYGPLSLENCPLADGSDIAYYTGGWDAVGVIKADDEAAGWRNILTFSYRLLRPRSIEYAKVIDEIAQERGRPARAAVYEAGPGYTLPGPGKFNIKEQEEGKSMAQAVNSLDSFMMNLALGFGEQAFFLFKNGHYWSSHNRDWGEHIVYKALKMRNTLLQGDLVSASNESMVTIDLPEAAADIVSQNNSADRSVRKFPAVPNVPLVACYPFREGKRWSFMLYARRIDAPTPVTIKLPYEPKSEMLWYTLGTNDPAAHNIEREHVTITEQVRNDAKRDYSFSLPPLTVLVLVNEER